MHSQTKTNYKQIAKTSCNCIKRILQIEDQLLAINQKVQSIHKSLGIPTHLNSKPAYKLHSQPQIQHIYLPSNDPRLTFEDKAKENISSETYHPHHQSEPDSFLLEDLQFIGKDTKVNDRNEIPLIGKEIMNLQVKIISLEEELKTIPKIRSNVSMLTKILQHLQTKTESIEEQLPKRETKGSLLARLQPIIAPSSESFDSLRFSEESDVNKDEGKDRICNKKK